MFVSLNEEEWKALESVLEIKHFKKGEFLIESGQVENFMSFVTEGLARIWYPLDGEEHSVAFTYEGFYACSYNSFTSRTPSKYSIEALEDVTLIGMNYEDEQELLNRFKTFERWARLEVEAAYFMAEQREISILTYSAKERYERLWKNSPRLFQRVPGKYLAQYLGMTAETFSRIRKNVEL